MTTKEQERKALVQIRKIVEGLGEDSYIGMAFEGCFGIAEDNIENDWACSMKQRFERADKEARDAILKVKELEKVNEKLKKESEEKTKNSLKSIEVYGKKMKEYEASARENWEKFRKQEDRADALELENMKLKAKLYDMMMAAAK